MLDARVHPSPETAGTEAEAAGPFTCTCMECGGRFRAFVATADFCLPAHKDAFNNRRKIRGAELYDLFMAIRYERSLAAKLGLWTKLCRLAWKFHQEDAEKRAGRKSWRHPQRVLERHPYLNATAFDVRPRSRRK